MYRKWIAEDEQPEPVPVVEAEVEAVVAEMEPDSMEMDFTEDDDELDDEEEEPPMEDLDLSDVQEAVAVPDDLLDEDSVLGMADADVGLLDDEEDDTGASLEDELLQLVAGEASAEERDSFAEDMLKAQGLDLAESELDDAISNLINELDGGSRASDNGKEKDAGEFKDDDMDMDMDMEGWDDDPEPGKPTKKS